MTFSSPVKASLVALALFMAVGGAEAGKKSDSLMPSGQVQDSSPEEIVKIRQFLAGGKDLSKMKLPRLQERLHRAQTFRDVPGLPPDLDQALQEEIARVAQEISRRQQGGAEPQQQQQQAQADTQQLPEPKLEQPPLPPYDPSKADAQQQGQDQQQPPVLKRKRQQQPAQDQAQQPAQDQAQQSQQQSPAGSAAVASFLQSVRPASQLSEAELRQQMQRAVELSQADGLSEEQRRALRTVIRDSRAGLQGQPQQAQQPAAQPPVAEQPATNPPAQQQAGQQPAGGSADVASFLQSVRPVSQLSEPELRQQMHRALVLSQSNGLSEEQRRALRTVIRDSRAALQGQPQQAQQQPAPQQPPATQQPPVAQQQQPTVAQQQAELPPPPSKQQLEKPTNIDPAMERQAQAYLNDNVDVRTMKRKQLRKRLGDIRDLLATNQLTPQTREALRQKLASERMVLRNEVAVDEGLPPPVQQQLPPQGQQQLPPQQHGQQPPPPQGGSGGSTTSNSNVTINNNTTVNNTNTDIRVVLQDRRPPQQLDDRELVRRIDVYREVVADDSYDEQQRMMWRQQMEDDRRYLRRQMIEERQQREARLRQGDDQFNYQVQDRYDPGYDVPDDVFAAEADDSEIADVLAAPPRRQIQQRYTVEDIERSPQVRDAVARIEIDTVHFGFGEGFLREEEIDKLDRIATVLEKILAQHPDEVFLIEGHTDAVGSDAANLVLSRQRAAAVKQALTTYYVIPPENLKTVGLGERYLKIPTDQPEAENRRVSLARITPLVGQAAD